MHYPFNLFPKSNDYSEDRTQLYKICQFFSLHKLIIDFALRHTYWSIIKRPPKLFLSCLAFQNVAEVLECREIFRFWRRFERMPAYTLIHIFMWMSLNFFCEIWYFGLSLWSFSHENFSVIVFRKSGKIKYRI